MAYKIINKSEHYMNKEPTPAQVLLIIHKTSTLPHNQPEQSLYAQHKWTEQSLQKSLLDRPPRIVSEGRIPNKQMMSLFSTYLNTMTILEAKLQPGHIVIAVVPSYVAHSLRCRH